MTGNELITLGTDLNGGAAISQTIYLQLLNLARSLIEGMRPWMILRGTDISQSVTTANTWQTAIDLSTITDFNRFYETDDSPAIRLFDGMNRIEYYRQVPFHTRLEYKDSPNTYVYDEANKTLYLNGTVNFAGTLYINYITNGTDITASDSSIWAFPSWSHPLLAFLAVAMNKAGVDYDEVNARQAIRNDSDASRILSALETWDTNKQLSEITHTDPYQGEGDFRSNAINIP